MDGAAKSRRLRIRTMVLITVGLVVLLGLTVILKLQAARDRAEYETAISHLEARGCQFSYYDGDSFLFGPPDINAKFLLHRLGLRKHPPRFTSLACKSGDLADDDLAWLKKLPQIQALYITDCAVSDDGFQNVRYLDNLKHVSLSKCEVTNETLGRLEQHSTLQMLFLFDTQISRGAIAGLKSRRPELYLNYEPHPP